MNGEAMAKNGDARFRAAAGLKPEDTPSALGDPDRDLAELGVSSPSPAVSCSTCDFMRHEGDTMRCYFNPPVPAVIGTAPPIVQGAPPRLIITGIVPEVHPGRFCRYHPLLRSARDQIGSPGYAGEASP